MMSFITGRIVELWQDEKGINLVLLKEATRYHFFLSEGLTVPKQGTLVRAEINPQNRMVGFEIMGESLLEKWDSGGDVSRWRQVHHDKTRLAILKQRQEILRAIRDDLYGQGFLEVQTPLLVPSTCPDFHIDSIEVGDEYLVTSTEYQLKRLIVGGIDKIFSLTQNFRKGEVGRYHNPEFTMLEWARTFASLADIEADVQRFTCRAFQHLYPGCSTLDYGPYIIDLFAPWEKITVREALNRYLHVQVDSDFSLSSILTGMAHAQLSIPDELDKDADTLITYLLDLVQPYLGTKVPTFLREWPAFMTSSAALDSSNPTVAERSELFIAGIEVADGFPSLQDATLQKALFDREQDRRRRAGKPEVMLDKHYLAALYQGIPQGAGMALGIDRLVMVLTQCQNIRDVLAFAWDER